MHVFIYRRLAITLNVTEIIHCLNYNNYYSDKEDVEKRKVNLESYDFWVLAYCRKGTIVEFGNNYSYTLSEGDVFFHCPNDAHNTLFGKSTASSCTFISFRCGSKLMNYFNGYLAHLTMHQRRILDNLIEVAKDVFADISDEETVGVNIIENAPFGAQQIYKNYLEIFLLELLRNIEQSNESIVYDSKIELEKILYGKIEQLLHENLYSHLTLDKLCHELNYSKPILSKIYKKYTSDTIMNRYASLKISEAKKLLSDTSLKIEKISQMLCCNTSHHFSTMFKKSEGITPSHYREMLNSAIKSKSNDTE